MSRNGAGLYTLPAGNPVVTGTVISSTWANNTLSDIATALTQSIANDGQTPITANISLSGNKITGLAAGTIAGDALTYGQSTWSLADGSITGDVALSGTLNMSGKPINEVQGADIASASTINLDTATGNLVDVTGTTAITAVTLSQGRSRLVRFTGILTLTKGASLVLPGGANITTAAGDYALFEGYASSVVRVAFYSRASGLPIVSLAQLFPVSKRQTVCSGPIDSNGQPNPGGSTGGTTYTTSGTFVATFANGFGASGSVDSFAVATNPAWIFTSSNGTFGVYADNIDGVLTPVNGNLPLPVITDSNSAPSVTSGQYTFNSTTYVCNVGNGSTAPQANRLCVGQVTISGGVISAFTMYAYNRKYRSPPTAIQATGTLLAFNHNLGVYPDNVTFRLRNVTSELGYSVGEEANPMTSTTESANGLQRIGTLAMYTFGLNTNRYDLPNLLTFSTSLNAITPANWNQVLTASTNW